MSPKDTRTGYTKIYGRVNVQIQRTEKKKKKRQMWMLKNEASADGDKHRS